MSAMRPNSITDRPSVKRCEDQSIRIDNWRPTHHTPPLHRLQRQIFAEFASLELEIKERKENLTRRVDLYQAYRKRYRIMLYCSIPH